MTPTMYPYLSYRDAAAALRFLEEAFGFATSVRWDAPYGTVQHAEVTFGEGVMMMGTADHPTVPLDGASVGQGIYVYVENVDAHFERAGGARVVYPPEDTEWVRAAIGCSTRRVTSGASVAIGPALRATRERLSSENTHA
jgi:uncharacterized glyoxalase superfamily protein PhnB